MGWQIGFDANWDRDIGNGVPAVCDHPGCDADIDRGFAYVCDDVVGHGVTHGCGGYFCPQHLYLAATVPADPGFCKQLCTGCAEKHDRGECEECAEMPAPGPDDPTPLRVLSVGALRRMSEKNR